VLNTIKNRIDDSLKGICSFKYVDQPGQNGPKALQVTMDPKKLVPAFPDLHLIDVDVKDRELLLKVGKI
jgi:hypothetical protein